MTPEPSFSDDLTTLDGYTARVLATARSIEDTGAPSLCDGWTRGHVLTHIARNAEGIGRLADWAATGTRQEMYPGGPESRDEAIEAGSRRTIQELRADLARTAESLAPRLAALQDSPAVDEVEMRGGLKVSALRLPFIRLREVVYHHVDLDAGFTFADVHDDLLARFIDDAVWRLSLARTPPAVELRSDEGQVWRVGEPTAYVAGSRAGLLLWLARRITTGVRSDGEVPTLPRGA